MTKAISDQQTQYEAISALLKAREFALLRETLEHIEAPHISEIISRFDSSEQAVLFRILPQKLSVSTFEYLDLATQESLLKALGQHEVAVILNEMAPDDRTSLLEELPGEVTKKLLMLLSPDERRVAQALLGYPEDSVGRLMSSDYIAVPPDWTVQQVLDYIRAYGQDSETLNVVFVVDQAGKLIDDIRVQGFLLAPIETKVEAIMNRQFVALTATDNQETAVQVFRKYDRVALPVTDTRGILIGIVTVDDIIDVAQEAATQDIQQIGGVEALDEPYMTIPLAKMIRKRGGWLVFLFLSEMLTTTAMGHFQVEIQRAVVLVLFIPLIVSSGGNSGSQAATLVIRALALGEISVRDAVRVLRREILTGLVLGIILGSIGFMRVAAWSMFSTVYGPHWLYVAWTVFFSLIGVVLWGTFSGALLPLVLKKLRLDPATSSAPFVATLVDVCGIIIYFTVASVILRGVLL